MWTRVAISLLLVLPMIANAQCEQLVWSDEFDEPGINSDFWSYDIGDGCPNLCGWGNGELQWYSDSEDNVFTEDGNLILRALEDGNGGYTSGKIKTRDKVSFHSGRIEARIKMPIGQGLWPAFWLLPDHDRWGGWPLGGEIDISEMLGQDPNQTYGTIHFGASWPMNALSGESHFAWDPNFSEEFHVHAVEWDENEIRWYVDDELFSTKTGADLGGEPWRFNREFYVILNVAVGGFWPGYPTDDTEFPTQMEVDYVRVYQNPETSWIAGNDVTQVGSVTAYTVPMFQDAQYEWTCTGCESMTANDNQVQLEWTDADASVSCNIVLDGCSNLISKEVEVLGLECESMVLDREGVAHMHRTGHMGSLFISDNPAPNEVNDSPNCYIYARNGQEVYDVLSFVADFATDASQFTSGEYVLAMDVRSSAPVGTVINLNLENNQLANSAYPTGRHSVYSAATSVQDEWETIYFNFSFQPDAGTADDQINQLVVLFAPGSLTSDFYYFDNFRVVDADCLTVGVGHNNIEFTISPNPASDEINLNSNVPVEHVEIRNQLGQICLQSGKTRIINISHLRAGTYWIRVTTNKGLATQKLIKQ